MSDINNSELLNSFQSILDNIIVSKENKAIKENLKREISLSFNLKNINKYLDDLSSLISLSTTENTKVQKAFIESLKNNIGELFKSIEDTESYQSSNKNIDEKMTNEMEDHIKTMSQNVKNDDLSSINEFLSNINATVSNFKKQKEKEEIKMKEKIEKLKKYASQTENKFRKLNIILEKKNKELITDKLTNVLNRRAFENMKDDYEFKENTSIAITDIDNFKSINDTFGHHNGDMALKAIAQVLSIHVDKFGKVFRYGGEEFVIFFECSKEKSLLILNNIKNYLNSNTFKITHNNNIEHLSLTLSFGYKEIQNNDDINDSYKIADEKLYEAKNTGKNKIVY